MTYRFIIPVYLFLPASSSVYLSLSVYLIVASHILDTFAVLFFSVLLEKGSQEKLDNEIFRHTFLKVFEGMEMFASALTFYCLLSLTDN